MSQKKQGQNKSKKDGGKQRAIKNQIEKRDKKRGGGLTKGNKKKEPKIKVLRHELLASTLSYLMLAPW
jgi:hypothetical protein